MGQAKGNAKFKNVSAYLLPILILGIFLAVMVSGPVLKEPLDTRHQISKTFSEMETNLKENNWPEAAANTQFLRSSLNNTFKILRYSVELDEMADIMSNLDRIEGFIQANDGKNALGELYEARGHWRELGS